MKTIVSCNGCNRELLKITTISNGGKTKIIFPCPDCNFQNMVTLSEYSLLSFVGAVDYREEEEKEQPKKKRGRPRKVKV